MKRKNKADVWRRFSRILMLLAAICLASISAVLALDTLGIGWQSWLRTKAGDVMAYISIDNEPLPGSVYIASDGDIKPVEWQGQVTAEVSGSDVALMSEPNGSSELLCSMKEGIRVTVIGQRGNWYRLRYSCHTGWAPLSYVRLTGDKRDYSDDLIRLERNRHANDAAAVAAIVSGSDINANMKFLENTYGAVGTQAAIIKNGEVVYTYSGGYANLKEGKPMTDQTKIRIASVSKMGVAMAAMVMAEQGIVDLDADISDYLGFEVKNQGHPEVPITLRMLLTHTSSMSCEISDNETYNSFIKKLKRRSSFQTSWIPGKDYTYSYSNAGICLAGMTLEAAADVVLVDFIDEYFFEPMGVDASYHPSHISDPDLIATLYDPNHFVNQSVKGQLDRPYSKKPGENFRLYAGDLTISAGDLARLVCVLAADGTYDGMYYLAPESVGEIEREHFSQGTYSQCLTLRRKADFIDGRTLYYHTGNARGTLAFICYDDTTRDGAVILTTGADCGNIKGVYSICYKMANLLMTELVPYTPVTEDAQQ